MGYVRGTCSRKLKYQRNHPVPKVFYTCTGLRIASNSFGGLLTIGGVLGNFGVCTETVGGLGVNLEDDVGSFF